MSRIRSHIRGSRRATAGAAAAGLPAAALTPTADADEPPEQGRVTETPAKAHLGGVLPG